jgi:hypothetical protein
MWLALIHLVTWHCLAVVVVGMGNGCGWRREGMMFGPSWAVTKGGGGDVQVGGGWEEESGCVWLPNKHCLYKKINYQ